MSCCASFQVVRVRPCHSHRQCACLGLEEKECWEALLLTVGAVLCLQLSFLFAYSLLKCSDTH